MSGIKSQILKWIEERISASPDFVIPTKGLHKELVDGLRVPVPPLDEIEGWLENDGRFDLFPEPDGSADLSVEQASALEQEGIYNGLRIGLKSKRPSQEEIVRRLEEHSTQLLAAVQKGYAAGEIEEESFEQLEDNLVEFLQKLQGMGSRQ
jgi:hypothetical protein